MSAGVPGLQKLQRPRATTKSALESIGLIAPASLEGAYLPDVNYGPDGTQVGCLTDLSRNGRHMLQTNSSAKPTLQTRSGGRRVARFDGSNDYLATGNGMGPEQVSIVGCVSLVSAPGSNNGLFAMATTLSSNDFTSGITLHQGTAGGANVNFLRTEGAKAAPATDLLNTTIPFDQLFTFSLILDDAFGRLYINGQEDGVISVSTSTIDAFVMAMACRAIGGATSFLAMDWRGLLIYSKALTREERLAAEAIV